MRLLVASIRFANPFFSPSLVDTMLERMKEVLESGWLTSGPNVSHIESFFEDYFLTPNVVALGSCTASLHLSMILSGVTKDAEVILPSETFVSTANSILYCGGTPIFAEIDPNTMNLDPADVEARITERTVAIAVVHIAGLPCEMKSFQKIAKQNDLILIEDCAHAHGSQYNGKHCGTFGDFACFSFYPTKVVPGAEGGLLITRDGSLKQITKKLRNQGREGFGVEAITEIGYNYRMNELQACVIYPQLEMLDTFVEKRNEIAKYYDELLSGVSKIETIAKPSNVKHSYYSYMIKVPPSQRNKIILKLGEKGIQTSVMYHPVHLQPAFRRFLGSKQGDLPITEDACSKLISLPMHLGLSKSDIEYVCNNLSEISQSLL